jgi:hypothetical protein
MALYGRAFAKMKFPYCGKFIAVNRMRHHKLQTCKDSPERIENKADKPRK